MTMGPLTRDPLQGRIDNLKALLETKKALLTAVIHKIISIQQDNKCTHDKIVKELDKLAKDGGGGEEETKMAVDVERQLRNIMKMLPEKVEGKGFSFTEGLQLEAAIGIIKCHSERLLLIPDRIAEEKRSKAENAINECDNVLLHIRAHNAVGFHNIDSQLDALDYAYTQQDRADAATSVDSHGGGGNEGSLAAVAAAGSLIWKKSDATRDNGHDSTTSDKTPSPGY